MNQTERIRMALRHGWELVNYRAGRAWLAISSSKSGKRIDVMLYADGSYCVWKF